MKQQEPCLVEIIGPAGAGKSSLLRELGQRKPNLALFADRLQARSVQNLPFYVGSGLAALPTLFQPSWRGRWYTREEISRLLYLVGMRQVFRQRSQTVGVTVVDQGPIFELTHLRAFGPARLTHDMAINWWRTMFRQWAPLFRLVVWLDAPDAVLLPRIRERAQAHVIKQTVDAEAVALLARYRSSFTTVIQQLQDHAPIPLLTFATHEASVSEIAEAMIAKIEQTTTLQIALSPESTVYSSDFGLRTTDSGLQTNGNPYANRA